MLLQLAPLPVLVLSILVLWIGVAVTSRSPRLQRLDLPPAVLGGVPIAVLLALLDLADALHSSHWRRAELASVPSG